MITYERAMLTLIAACMIGLLARDLTRRPTYFSSCGDYPGSACYIRSSTVDPIKVEIIGTTKVWADPALPVKVDNASWSAVPVYVAR